MTPTPRTAAATLVHHYYCRLPNEGPDACAICSAIEDPEERGTMTVLIDRLAFEAESTPGLRAERLQCGNCGDWLLLSEIEGHLNSEGRSLAAECRATVERIRAAIEAAPRKQGDDYCGDCLDGDAIDSILDAEAAR